MKKVSLLIALACATLTGLAQNKLAIYGPAEIYGEDGVAVSGNWANAVKFRRFLLSTAQPRSK